MKKISIWGRKNRGSARILIILLNLALALLGIQTGILLVKMNFHFSPLAFYLVLLVFISALFVYPQRNRSWSLQLKRKFYRIQKACDFILAFCSFLMISFFSENSSEATGSKLSFPFLSTLSASNGAKPTADEILLSLQHRSKKDLTRSEKRTLKHEFFKQAKVYVIEKAKGNDQIALKFFLVLCTLAAAVGVGYLVGALACSLACSGMDGLAVLVALLGLGGIIFGSIKLIKAISHISGKKQTTFATP
jgi:hypothetical protein